MQIIRQKDCESTFFERPEGMSPLVHRLLMRRGIASAEEAERFLHPTEEDLHDPYLLNDMDAAVRAIRAAMAAGQNICVYGDYDVDGVSASAILSGYLRSAGASVEVYIPSRHEEGYGLNENAIRDIATRAALMVTVDCGVTSVELVALAKSLGLVCVVTDHHRPADTLPDCPVVNPLLNGYPFGALCGAGVAFRLVEALAGRDVAMRYIDIAALATIADIVALRDENRFIVREGLRRMTESPRPGIRALMEASGEPLRKITAETVGFRLAPRLNAAGRLGSARRAYELLMTEDDLTAASIAAELEEENTRRKSENRRIQNETLTRMRGFDLTKHRAIVMAGEDWNPGVIGLAASYLTEVYNVPVILMADRDGICTGSCRSIPGVDIHDALTAVSEHLERFGGHSQAAGLTIRREKLPDFIRALDIYLHMNIPAETFIPVAEYDDVCALSEITERSVNELEALEPTGCGNPEPVFRADASVVECRAVGKDGSHLKLTLSGDGVRVAGVAFGKGAMADTLGDRVSVLFRPQINEFRGMRSAEMGIRTVMPDNRDVLSGKRHIEADLQRDFLTSLLYNGNKVFSAGEGMDIGIGKLTERLIRDPKGTLIVTATVEETARILDAVRPAFPDVSFGTMPTDPRGFNTVCCCPRGPVPAGYHCVVLAGVKELEGVPDDAELLRFATENPWSTLLPDIDAFREVYKVLRGTLARPARRDTFSELIALIAPYSHTSHVGTAAALIALKDMGLIELEPDSIPIRVGMKPVIKSDPAENGIWKRIQEWKQG